MSLINLTDSIVDVVSKLSKGNPGAASVMVRIFNEGEGLDPDSWAGNLTPLLSLDSYEIYGPDIWILYKDICGQDIVNMCAVLRAVQLGLVDQARLKAQISARNDGLGRGDVRFPLDVPDILKAVMERLPGFNRKPAIPEADAS